MPCKFFPPRSSDCIISWLCLGNQQNILKISWGNSSNITFHIYIYIIYIIYVNLLEGKMTTDDLRWLYKTIKRASRPCNVYLIPRCWLGIQHTLDSPKNDVYIYMYIYIYIHVCIYVYMYICIYVYMYICICILCICICICIRIYVNVYVSIYIWYMMFPYILLTAG